jgi:hypothetical protein
MAESREVHCLRVREGGREWWVLHDGDGGMTFKNEATRAEMRRGWVMMHGQPDAYIWHAGYHGLAEVAAIVAEMVTPEEPERGRR